MKDIVIYETAVRMKEAGFPQPTPEAGQFWYYKRFPGGTAEKNVLCVLAHEYPYQNNLEAIPLDGGERPVNPRNTQIFAPTATDILRMMPDYELLSFATQDPVLFIDTITDVAALAAMWLGQNETIEAKINRASKTWEGTDTNEFIKKVRE